MDRGPLTAPGTNTRADSSHARARADREPSSSARPADVASGARVSQGDSSPAHVPHHAPSAPPTPFDAVLAALPPPPPAPSALLAHAAEDLSLHATVMPERAVLSIDAGSAGELALHLRVKDGVADVRVAGSAAHSIEIRPSELRAALASEGLTLGSFQSGQPAPEHNHPGDRVDDDATTRQPSRAAAVTTAAAATNDSSPTAVASRGLHVTA